MQARAFVNTSLDMSFSLAARRKRPEELGRLLVGS